jgi:hypothetical protein
LNPASLVDCAVSHIVQPEIVVVYVTLKLLISIA